MMRNLAILVLLVFSLGGKAGERDPKAVAKKKLVEVVLTCSTEKLDPLKPGEHDLKCVVRNVSDRAVEVPTFYSGGYESDLKLEASHRWELTLVKWAGIKKVERKKLEPGKEMVVFQDTLRNLFLLDVENPKGLALKPREERYYWSWIA